MVTSSSFLLIIIYLLLCCSPGIVWRASRFATRKGLVNQSCTVECGPVTGILVRLNKLLQITTTKLLQITDQYKNHYYTCMTPIRVLLWLRWTITFRVRKEEYCDGVCQIRRHRCAMNMNSSIKTTSRRRPQVFRASWNSAPRVYAYHVDSK